MLVIQAPKKPSVHQRILRQSTIGGVAMIALFLMLAGRVLRIPRLLLGWVVLLLLVLYLGVIGAPPAAVRSVLMFAVVVPVRQLLDRHMTLQDSLMLAAAIALAADPRAVWSLSFQLSFLGMAGIAWITPVLSPRLLSHPAHAPPESSPARDTMPSDLCGRGPRCTGDISLHAPAPAARCKASSHTWLC